MRRKTRQYTGTFTHGGGFGGGYGGTYTEQLSYTSEHRAGSKANRQDALDQWRLVKGRAGWAELESTYLDDED